MNTRVKKEKDEREIKANKMYIDNNKKENNFIMKFEKDF